MRHKLSSFFWQLLLKSLFLQSNEASVFPNHLSVSLSLDPLFSLSLPLFHPDRLHFVIIARYVSCLNDELLAYALHRHVSHILRRLFHSLLPSLHTHLFTSHCSGSFHYFSQRR